VNRRSIGTNIGRHYHAIPEPRGRERWIVSRRARNTRREWERHRGHRWRSRQARRSARGTHGGTIIGSQVWISVVLKGVDSRIGVRNPEARRELHLRAAPPDRAAGP
jgi:hypothetical protein